MNRILIYLIAAVTVSLGILPATAQRRINPVDNPATRTQHINNKVKADTLDRTNIVEKTDSHGNKILVDTVTGKEVVDSTQIPVVPPMIYPLVNSASVSVNVWDPIMRVLGQKYGLVEFSAEFNMHNRYIPVFDFGLGKANNTPDGNNYTYRSPMAPYFRIGMNYNFLYNSSPDYMAMAGIRYGFSPFSYSVDGTSLNSGYWQEQEGIVIPSQNVTAGYFMILFNLRVKVSGPIYVGWSFNYHTILHESKTPHGKPWYIPGYGTRGSSVGGAFSVTYTFDLAERRKKKEKINNEVTLPREDIYPDSLPPLPEGADPTTTPHYHPAEQNPPIEQLK